MSATPETDAIADFYLAKALSKDPADRTVPCQFAARLERDLNRAIRERDEALHAIHTYKCETEAWELLQEARRERDEAREAIPAGEWVAHEDYKKIHDAASRLLVAINKELPIGCFILINSEYHRLQNAIYGREGAK